MKIQDLKKVNIDHVTLHALLVPCDQPELFKKVRPGVQDTVRIVTAMLSHNLSDDVIRIDSAAEMVGGNVKKMRDNISDAIKISCDEYEGNFGRPPIIPVDQFVYLVVALSVQEFGRFTDDPNEYIVMSHLSDYLDIGAIQDEYDMRCYIFLIDYFIDCLTRNERLPLSQAIEMADSPYVTSQRLKKYLRKNGWFSDPDEVLELLKIKSAAPTPTQVADSIFRSLKKKLKRLKKEAAEQAEQ